MNATDDKATLDTPEPDQAARVLAERLHSAYAQQAEGTLHPQAEQTLLARLAEAARSRTGPDESGGNGLVRALNAALDAFEETEPSVRGPRVREADAVAGTVTLATGP